MRFEKSPPWLVALFDEVAASLPGERRKMFGYPCLFLGGNLYCGLFQATMMLRLGEQDREALLALPGAAPFDPMGGRPMREYAVLPRDLLDDDRALRDWLRRSAAYASSLPTRKPKAEGRKPRAKGSAAASPSSSAPRASGAPARRPRAGRSRRRAP
jgi:TfoX/Sxy family transcriptional regulator of competence genes